MTVHETFAQKINDGLKRGRVTVTDTAGLDSFCDDTSIALDNHVISLIHDERDRDTIKLIYDTELEYKGGKYYIEPYNARLMNVSKI